MGKCTKVYAVAGRQKTEISAKQLLYTGSTFSKSVIVSVGVSTLGSSELELIEPE